MVGSSELGFTIERGDEHAALVLSGSALASELQSSPVHVEPVPFQRVGLMFDSDRPSSIEVATSSDGVTWSAWQAVDLRYMEVDRHGTFVGEVAVAERAATRFKLRGAPGQATYARIDVLGTMSDEWEGNDATGDSTAFLPAALPLPGLTIRSRADWNARTVSCGSAHTPKKLTIHHTDTPNNDTLTVPARLRQIQQYHRSVRGWCDIGYHYLISPDGQIWEGRPVTHIGAHTAGANTNNVGIALLGSFNTVEPTSAQLEATANLVNALGERYGIALSRATVKGHREQGTTPTDCPGAVTYRLLSAIVNAANTGPVTNPEPPPATSFRVEGVVHVGNDPTDRVAGATVTIGTRSATTSFDGTYVIDGVTPGTYDVRVRADGYETATFTRQLIEGAMVSASLVKAATTGTTPTGTAGLQGVVYFGTNGLDRIPYATVELSTGQTIVTSSSGYYVIGNLPPGPITIRASAPGYDTNQVARTLVNGQTEWGSVSLSY